MPSDANTSVPRPLRSSRQGGRSCGVSRASRSTGHDGRQVIEITASSPKSVEDAVRSGLKKVSETVKGIQGAWVNETKVVTNGSGEITEWRVNLRVTFLVE